MRAVFGAFVGKGATGRITGTLIIVLLCLYFLLPLWWLLVASTKDNSGLFAGSAGALWFDEEFHLIDNIAGLAEYERGIYWRWMLNSFVYAAIGGVGATVLAMLAGYGLSKFRFYGRRALLIVILAAVMVPTTALAIPLFVLFSGVGLTNTMWAVVLPSMLNPFGAYLMLVFADQLVPDDLMNAARIDGAGEIRTFIQIAAPLMRPGIVTVLLLSIVQTWNNYFLPLVMLTDVRLLPVTVGLNSWQIAAAGSNGVINPWNFIVTGAFVSVIPLIVIFLSLQRYWQGGLTSGSLK